MLMRATQNFPRFYKYSLETRIGGCLSGDVNTPEEVTEMPSTSKSWAAIGSERAQRIMNEYFAQKNNERRKNDENK